MAGKVHVEQHFGDIEFAGAGFPKAQQRFRIELEQ
jgi:hypothetical protein